MGFVERLRSFSLKPGLKALGGAPVGGPQSFSFDTGGPAVLQIHPYPGSVERFVRTHASGLPEPIAVRRIEGADRNDQIRAYWGREPEEQDLVVEPVLRLRPDVGIELVWGASYLVAEILADRGNRSVTFGLESDLATRSLAAVKTGTSKDMRDNGCIGFSDRYTVGVWVGNGGGEPMWNVSGVEGASPIWRTLMDALHADDPSVAPVPPEVVFVARFPLRS